MMFVLFCCALRTIVERRKEKWRSLLFLEEEPDFDRGSEAWRVANGRMCVKPEFGSLRRVWMWWHFLEMEV
jgi:hypothetical protein